MKHATFSLSLILGLALFACLTASAWAVNNLATDLCTSCTTAAQFQTFAESNIPSGAYFETATGPKMEVEFLIFNPGASLAAAISVHGSCLSTADGAPCSWDMTWIEETGSTTDMEQDFEELAPSLAIAVPPSVAPTFTGTSQASAVSAWLAQETAGVVAPLGADVLTVFPDGSSAEYTVTGTNPTAYGFVSPGVGTPRTATPRTTAANWSAASPTLSSPLRLDSISNPSSRRPTPKRPRLTMRRLGPHPVSKPRIPFRCNPR